MKDFNIIKLKNDFYINIIQYNNLYSNSFRDFHCWKWSDWLNKLQIPMTNLDKYKRGLVLYGDVKDEEDSKGNIIEKYRKDSNIINRSVITLDYDNISNFRALYNAINKQLGGIAWFYHTTYSCTQNEPRIRLMIPLSEPISAADYRKYSKALAEYIGHEVDEASFVPSQAMALPVIKDKNVGYGFKYNDAPAITRKELDRFSEEKQNEKIIINYSNQHKKHSNEYWREIAFGVGEGERNKTLASLIGYLLRRYVDANLVYGLVSAWAMTCTPPIEQNEVNKTFNSILKKDNQRTRNGGF